MNRAPGDHGEAIDAIDFALDHEPDGDADNFLRRWREGDLSEWPEFYEWLAKRETSRAGREPNDCRADRDGDCIWRACPQLRDGEPRRTGRHCPFDAGHDEI